MKRSEAIFEPPKVVRTLVVWTVLFEVHFVRQRHVLFRWRHVVLFLYFDFQINFVPQRRILFRHLNFKKGSRMVCFVSFDLEICFASQRRTFFQQFKFQSGPELKCFGNLCDFLFFIWPVDSAPAALANPFRPSGATNYCKTKVFPPFLFYFSNQYLLFLSLSLYSKFFSLFLLLFVHAVEFDKFEISETCYFSGILVLRDFMSTK